MPEPRPTPEQIASVLASHPRPWGVGVSELSDAPETVDVIDCTGEPVLLAIDRVTGEVIALAINRMDPR